MLTSPLRRTRSRRRAPWGASAALVAWSLSAPLAASADDGPVYASPHAKEAIGRMLAAHGGLDAWKRHRAAHWQASFEVHFGGDNWVPYREEMNVELATRCVYARLPNADGTAGRIAYDGERAWSAGSLQGLGRAPARFTAWRDFYLFSLPWMTQDAGVRLGDPVRRTLPLDGQEYLAIAMTFGDDAGDTPRDRYTLYLDPRTHRLHAAEYVMTYASMMAGKEESPPSIFVWEETVEADGLVVPARYTVYWTDGGKVAVRNGTITHWKFDDVFDRGQLAMPADGTPDASSPR